MKKYFRKFVQYFFEFTFSTLTKLKFRLICLYRIERLVLRVRNEMRTTARVPMWVKCRAYNRATDQLLARDGAFNYSGLTAIAYLKYRGTRTFLRLESRVLVNKNFLHIRGILECLYCTRIDKLITLKV